MVLACALCESFCLFPLWCVVIHQHASTQEHPVTDNLNVNNIQLLLWKKSPLFVSQFVPMLSNLENT